MVLLQILKKFIKEVLILTNLKPCPFCGGDAKLKTIIDSDHYIYYVKCSNTRCKVRAYTLVYRKKHEAIQAWNRRTIKKDGV